MCLPGSHWSWRIPLVFQIIPALILGIGMNWFPFSPRWLMSRNREAAALNVLAEIRCGDPSDIQAELDGIKRELALESETETDSHLSVANISFIRRLILGMGIQIFSQLTGINSIMYYAPTIFKQTSFTDDKALLMTGLIGCVNVVATIPAVIFIDKVGRRFLLLVGSIIMAVSMVSIGILMGVYGERTYNAEMDDADVVFTNDRATYAIHVFIFIFISGFAFSYGPIHWIYCSEIFSLSKRAAGSSITTAVHWSADVVVSFVVPVLLANIWFKVYIMFGVFSVLMGLLIFLFYPETKGVALEQMDKLFCGPICVLSRSDAEQTKNCYQDDNTIHETTVD
jgi:sugar porter (SP) family MFS transporter